MKIPIVAYGIMLEMIVLAVAYSFSPWGLAADRKLAETVQELTLHLEHARQRHQLFEKRIERWCDDEEFSIEKAARERLHMIKPGDVVYRLS